MGVEIKGQSIVAFERALTELEGPGAIAKVVRRLPEAIAKPVANKEVLAGGWYPMEWFGALHAAANEEFGAEVSRKIGRTATRHDVTTIYRFILKFLSPDTVIKHYQRVFALFCDGAKVVVQSHAKGKAVVRCSGCDGATQGVWEDILGSSEVVLELCGAKSASARIVSGAGNTGEMVCEFTWS